ncbi:hypothetical protein U5801_12220 [Lamprobacter modestohalophilus]|nr:hypothetical protein [Lamprobacter modestohalophilus]MEA1050568.1 hypothetical protein [Lamprobacter modestohalophilus]
MRPNVLREREEFEVSTPIPDRVLEELSALRRELADLRSAVTPQPERVG